VFIISLSLSGFSQLKVVSSGNVGVGTTSPDAKLEVSNSNPVLNHCAKFTGPSSLATVLIGGASQNTPYELYVGGEAYSSGGWITSDELYKKNIKALDGNEVLAKLLKIDGKKYEFKSKSELENILKNDTLGLVPNFPSGGQYGLIAQELEKEFPELVRLDSFTMTRAINYDGMIPILLEAIKAQQAQIDVLLVQIEDCCKDTKSAALTGTDLDTQIDVAKLYQNTPKPFNTQTTIRYEIPETVQSAQLHICNMNGTLLKTITVNQRGAGNVIISANEFVSGMYLYSLVCDGKIVDTKQMLLTK
ncbi:MAG: tail fiber domain-containing protein, partial [Draconibacterium sp.]|nr:tail fiber domain-containing protein [Draconibacterium sp.]